MSTKMTEVRTKYTSRLLAKEFRQKGGTLNEEDFFAGTPLLEALRFLVSKCVTDDPESQRKGLKKLLITDVKQAYFNAPVQRKMLIEVLPEDLLEGKDKIGEVYFVSLWNERRTNELAAVSL